MESGYDYVAPSNAYKRYANKNAQDDRQMEEEFANILGMRPFQNSNDAESDEEGDECDDYNRPVMPPPFVSANNNRNSSIFQKLESLRQNLMRSPTPKSTICAGAGLLGGWIIGGIVRKIGRATAMGIGTGFIVIQVATYSGYIQINWNRLQRDTDKAIRMVRDAEKRVSQNKSSVQHFIYCVKRKVASNGMVASAFVAGILIAFYW